MKYLIVALAALLLVVGEARAGVYIEPFVGYGVGDVKFTAAGPSGSATVGAKMKGLDYGGRVGLKSMMFAVGGEYQASDLKFDRGGSNWKPVDIGAFIGVFAPLGFRAWFTYFISSKAAGVKGTGMKLGLGYRFLLHLAINAEYVKRDYKIESVTTTSTLKTDDSVYGVSLSLPFSL
jgi:hypothetical protein